MMKELYISPELEILLFEAMEEIANVWDRSNSFYNGARSGAGLDSEPSMPGDVEDNEENMDPLE